MTSRALLQRAAHALTASAILAGCANGDTGGAQASATPTPAQRAAYPEGVIADEAALSHTRGVYGVLPGVAERCCWLAAGADFDSYAEPGAASLRLSVIQPAVPELRHRPQKISVLGNDGRVMAVRAIAAGSHDVVVPLTSQRGPHGRVTVHVRLAVSFVPSELHTSGDVRRLSLILTKVASVRAQAPR